MEHLLEILGLWFVLSIVCAFAMSCFFAAANYGGQHRQCEIQEEEEYKKEDLFI